MFELMQPKKELVGKRIGIVKDELGVSFTELGNRLGIIKPTINSYVQGYNLAPLEVIEKLEKITGRSVGWFYFGDMEEYIRNYLLKKGYKVLLSDYPNIPAELKLEFVSSENLNWDWKNEFGYPHEESIDEIFLEIYYDIMKEYISRLTNEYVLSNSSVEPKKREEMVFLIAAKVYECFSVLEDFKYGEKDKIKKYIKPFYEKYLENLENSFSDQFLIGKLINVLADEKETMKIIERLSMELTGRAELSSNIQLIETFQAMRPTLITLYEENNKDVS